MKPEHRRDVHTKISAETKILAKPIDFKDLESKGILIKEGAWYRVSDFKNLPEHVRVKVFEIRKDDKGIKVKLEISSSVNKYTRIFEKLGL